MERGTESSVEYFPVNQNFKSQVIIKVLKYSNSTKYWALSWNHVDGS